MLSPFVHTSVRSAPQEDGGPTGVTQLWEYTSWPRWRYITATVTTNFLKWLLVAWETQTLNRMSSCWCTNIGVVPKAPPNLPSSDSTPCVFVYVCIVHMWWVFMCIFVYICLLACICVCLCMWRCMCVCMWHCVYVCVWWWWKGRRVNAVAICFCRGDREAYEFWPWRKGWQKGKGDHQRYYAAVCSWLNMHNPSSSHLHYTYRSRDCGMKLKLLNLISSLAVCVLYIAIYA